MASEEAGSPLLVGDSQPCRVVRSSCRSSVQIAFFRRHIGLDEPFARVEHWIDPLQDGILKNNVLLESSGRATRIGTREKSVALMLSP